MAGLPSASRHHTHQDILAMYPSLRIDHLRYLERCGVLKPEVIDSDRFFGFADLSLLRQIAAELRQGAPFRAVARSLRSSQSGQLAFDFGGRDSARLLELKPRVTSVRVLDPIDPFTAVSGPERYFLMGSLLDDGTPERVEEAVKAYRRALEEDPDLVPALINLANVHYSRDQLAEALALYERAISLDDSYFEAHFNLANINLDLGRYTDAEASYRVALTLKPDYADAHFYMAITLDRLGRPLDARTYWQSYQRLSPDGEHTDLPTEFPD